MNFHGYVGDFLKKKRRDSCMRELDKIAFFLDSFFMGLKLIVYTNI